MTGKTIESVAMSPFGVCSSLPDEISSDSLTMNTINESTSSPMTVSENSSQDSCQSTQILNETNCNIITTSNRAYSQMNSTKAGVFPLVKCVKNSKLTSCSTNNTLTLNNEKEISKLDDSCELNQAIESTSKPEKQKISRIEKSFNDTPELKVVVQAMPTDYGNISALKQVIYDTISRKSWLKMKSKQNKSLADKRCNDQEWNPGRCKILEQVTNTPESSDEMFSNSSKRKKLNPRLCFDIEPGNGLMLSDIPNVSVALRKCSERTLQVIHYLLFNSYGGVGFDKSIKQTLRNIMSFSGYTFQEFSSAYNKKHHCLMRLPYPMLLKIYNVLVQQMSVERPTMVTELMKFCMKPVRERAVKLPDIKPYQTYDEHFLKELKTCAMNGPSPLVVLEKLSEPYIKQIENDIKLQKQERNSTASFEDTSDYCPNYIKPSFISDGPGLKLKEFPYVTSGIFKTRRRIINLIHCLLFKRPGSLDCNRLNILEFNGFLQSDNLFLEKKLQTLKRYKKKDLVKIFDIFRLNPKESKLKRMEKLLLFLQAPSSVLNNKRVLPAKNRSCTRKLRDIEKVCLNIECSPPKELAPLNDLLFIKPCDVSEIHQKILNFMPFEFDENSEEFHYRKTLLHYMNIGVIRRIAQILDIPNWDHYESQDELSSAILNFLMKLERPVQRRKGRQQNGRRSNDKRRPTILTVQKERISLNQENPVSSSDAAICNSTDDIRLESDEGNSNATVVIQRITDSSYSWTDSRNNGPITISDRNSDEGLTLNEFARHPTENQLELTIKEVICSSSWNITTGDLLNKVLHNYPRLNLTYRIDFIKSKALEILQEMQECMVDSAFDE